MSHTNDGACAKCNQVINTYPDFNQDLHEWFEAFQKLHPEMHVSCAGRGRVDQEACFQRGASKAHWAQSAHNYNCAMDLFVELPGEASIYPVAWFHNILAPALPDFIEWYGAPHAVFQEMPHIEVLGWRTLLASGGLKLVE